MANEINLFEAEIERSSLTRTTTPREQYRLQTEAQPKEAPQILQHLAQQEQLSEEAKQMRQQVKRVMEALLFAYNEPISFNRIREIADQLHPLRPRELRDILSELQQEYITQQRAFRLEEIGEGYLLRTCEELSPYIDLLLRNKRTERLSHAATEVLAIIAYRQPITRPQIEQIRGVDSSGVVASLLERGLIQPVGRLEAPGRPTLYGITNEFLQHFGLKDVKELPAFEE
ncbi:MAG: SMC-Scp complex subunit ScpB [Chlamydiales bacterium]|nr:SMC-Scp complex subunit ScpB [Chlamydiia bacterium]MCP5507784.1 SMC-Scp complex subunit ScpB [Chlamydiales bacterium]